MQKPGSRSQVTLAYQGHDWINKQALWEIFFSASLCTKHLQAMIAISLITLLFLFKVPRGTGMSFRQLFDPGNSPIHPPYWCKMCSFQATTLSCARKGGSTEEVGVGLTAQQWRVLIETCMGCQKSGEL